jgi:hypothetical protein
MAWEALKPILTPAALASIQNDATPLLTMLIFLIGVIIISIIIWLIDWKTRPLNPPPKPAGKKRFLMSFGKK